MDNNKIYEQVNERIISLLEKGVAPWRKPWKTGKIEIARNMISKKPYRGCNFFITNSMGYTSPLWGTFNQIKSKGGNVKKGEKGTIIVFWKTFDIKEKKECGKEVNKTIPFLRTSYIFNFEQCENLKIEETKEEELSNHDPIESCELLRNKFPLGMPELRHNQGRAFYNPTLDYISLPEKGLYKTMEEYYQTFFHETIHATGHKSRLNRDTLNGFNYFGDEVYSQEELVAEMGASYLACFAGIDNAVIDNSASYLNGWLNALRKDNKLLLKAASQAQKAVDFLIGPQFAEAEEAGEE